MHACYCIAESLYLVPDWMLQTGDVLHRRMLFADFLSMEFRIMKLRGKNEDCIVCSNRPTITKDNLSVYDYVAFAGQSFEREDASPLELLPASDRLSPVEFSRLLDDRETHPVMLIDVRPRTEFEICRVKGAFGGKLKLLEDGLGSVTYPYAQLSRSLPEMIQLCRSRRDAEIVVVCRRGHDSQIVAQELKKAGIVDVKDLRGGLEDWAKDKDNAHLS